MDTLYTFGDNITHYKTEGVHCLGLMNSATKYWMTSQPIDLDHPGPEADYLQHPEGPS